jgi:hypothetical protein
MRWTIASWKSQRLQNRVLLAIGNLDRCTSACEWHVALKILYVYDYITKLCRIHAELILNHVNPNVRGTGQGEDRHRKYRRLKLGFGQACPMTVQLTNCSFRVIKIEYPTAQNCI